MSIMKYLSFCFFNPPFSLSPPRSRWPVLGFASPPPAPCPKHPPPPQAARFLAQILLLISETARGDEKVKITSRPAYD